MLIDCFLFRDEFEILDLRLHELDELVDRFVLVESSQGFSGRPKPLLFKENAGRFAEFSKKIVRIEAPPAKFGNTREREKFQRNHVLKGLEGCSPDDVVMISDVDEIPRKETIRKFCSDGRQVRSLHQPMYIYYLNGLWDTDWIGTVITTYGHLMSPKGLNQDPNDARLKRRFRKDQKKVLREGGWHFSYLGTPKEIAWKMQFYAEQKLNKPDILEEKRLAGRIEEGWEIGSKNRPVCYVPVDGTFPEYLLKNPEQFKKMIRGKVLHVRPRDVSVVFTTSFVPQCHPCPRSLLRSARSLNKIFPAGQRGPEIILSCDFSPDPKYLEYKKRAKEAIKWSKVLEAQEPKGYQGVLKAGVEAVRGKLLLVWQHDFEMIKDVDFGTIQGLFASPVVKCLRLLRNPLEKDGWNRYLKTVEFPGRYKICATSGWSDNPHFARRDYYLDTVLPLTRPDGGSKGVETRIWPEFDAQARRDGFFEANRRFGTFALGLQGEPPHIRHLFPDRRKKALCEEEGKCES